MFVKWAYKDKLNGDILESPLNVDGDFDNQGGINFTTIGSALRWLSRGDTLYDVDVFDDSIVINVENSLTPNGIYRADKIKISNPREISDALALELYDKCELPLYSFSEALAALAMNGCINTCLKMVDDRVNGENVNTVINIYREFGGHHKADMKNQECFDKVHHLLHEIEVANR